jgi:hypothetical protein
MRGANSSTVKHGVVNGLKLATHVSMASATTSFYNKSGVSALKLGFILHLTLVKLRPDDSSDAPETVRGLLEVSMTHG